MAWLASGATLQQQHNRHTSKDTQPCVSWPPWARRDLQGPQNEESSGRRVCGGHVACSAPDANHLTLIPLFGIALFVQVMVHLCSFVGSGNASRNASTGWNKTVQCSLIQVRARADVWALASRSCSLVCQRPVAEVLPHGCAAWRPRCSSGLTGRARMATSGWT